VIRVDSNKLSALLTGKPVEVEYRGPTAPLRAESHPVALHELTDVRVFVTHSRLKPKKKRIWLLDLILDRQAAPLLLNAESAGGVITPLGESRSEDSPEAHGYSEKPSAVLDAGEAMPTDEIASYEASKMAAHRFASEQVDQLSKRRAKTLGNRVRETLMRARAQGLDPTEYIDAIEEQLAALDLEVREAA
jgi:hypothetical protein